MYTSTIRNVSTIALLLALASGPNTQAFGQSSNASPQGQAMGQGNANSNSAAGNNPNSGPGQNSGQGNTSPASVTGSAGGSEQTPGPDEGHECGGQGHIDNDAPGHQHDDCHAAEETTGAANKMNSAAPAGDITGSIKGLPNAAVQGSSGPTADCSSYTEVLTPIFGMITEDEAEVLATTDQAALVPVACAEMSTDPDAQQIVASNPGLVSALAAQGYGVHQVITVQVGDPIPTIYVEATDP